MPNQKATGVDLRGALRTWAKKRNMRPIDFSRAMGFSYNYSWRMLNGRERFGPQSWGAFASVYGLEALQEIFRIGQYQPKGDQKK